MKRYIVFSGVFCLCSNGIAETPSEWWNLARLKTSPEHRWVEEAKPIREVVYENGVTYQGRKTETFAFFASPGTLGEDGVEKPYPGVVLIHGGGGTAFSEWVHLWAKRGYAAIAMDLSGRRPPSPAYDEESGAFAKDMGLHKGPRERLVNGGPDHTHVEKFENVGGDITDDWQYHTVANVMRAHSLLAGFPDVDADRIAVTGISWGGYSTCLVASVDDRFKAAVPVYGCGFLYEGESVQKPRILELDPEKRDLWIQRWDPSVFLQHCRVPILFVNGTHDKHYPLDSYQRSFDVVPGEKWMRIEPRMAHGHQPGWAPREIGIFVDSKCREGAPLLSLSPPEVENGEIQVKATGDQNIKSASLHYTSDTGLRTERKWQEADATVEEGGVIRAKAPPADANTWFLTVTDERGAMISTTVTIE